MSDYTSQKAPGSGNLPWKGRDKFFVEEVRMDFSSVNVGSGETSAVFDVKAGHLILGMSVNVVTAEGGTATVDIGITGTDVDKFIDGANINATANLSTPHWLILLTPCTGRTKAITLNLTSTTQRVPL